MREAKRKQKKKRGRVEEQRIGEVVEGRRKYWIRPGMLGGRLSQVFLSFLLTCLSAC
jgi:hypothetical protein